MSTSIQYRSTFTPTTSERATTPAGSTPTVTRTPEASTTVEFEPSSAASDGSLSSFICHTAYLEKNLRADSSIFFDTNHEILGARSVLGQGTSFRVERAEWRTKDLAAAPTTLAKQWGKYVALKSVLPRERFGSHDQFGGQENWQDILLEVRALLHEPLRYHPNIAHLLGLGWESSNDANAVYPILIVEYAGHGTLRDLQVNAATPLPFRIKQKLCHDVAKGLSILHACGIVHGDLKHENVLVFDNKYNRPEGQPYTAKLADFGGAVMDISTGESHSLRMGTYPYDAPEASKHRLSSEGVKLTDVYSYGLLVWRTFIDGRNILADIEVDGAGGRQPVELPRAQVHALKTDDELLTKAVMNIQKYSSLNSICDESVALILYVLAITVRSSPELRQLSRAQAALRGTKLDEIEAFLQQIELQNKQRDEVAKNEEPGRHGMNVDSVGFNLGRLGDEYDAQQNKPGFRPSLSHPEKGEFLFEPEKLKSILRWEQQEQMVKEFEQATRSKHTTAAVKLQPYKAAFYLFQCYLTEFGVEFNAERACFWLLETSKAEDSGDVDYFAQAWIWRIANAFSVPLSIGLDKVLEYLKWGTVRGHRLCLEDGKAIMSRLSELDRNNWQKELNEGEKIFRTMAGGVGMPHYAPRKLRKNYNLENYSVLDQQLREDLSPDYELCLISSREPNADPSNDDDEEMKKRKTAFDRIFVNHRGHGLLHYAATMGNVGALRHMVKTYNANLDLPNQSVQETPLVCACRSGNFDCAMFLLESGAGAGPHEFGLESPLHWLCSFEEPQMTALATKLIAAGAELENPSGLMRADIRHINADWEHLFGVSVTPLGRAVLMKSLPAVKVLLKLGANPLAKLDLKMSKVGQSAIEIAALLTLPHILEVLLLYLDQTSTEKQPFIFDEGTMLRTAHAKTFLSFDSTSLQSRLVRHGAEYKVAMFQTLQILHRRHQTHRTWLNADSPSQVPGQALCEEVKRGNIDIVEALLELGHDANGSPGHRPIAEAVLTHNERAFRLLIGYNANIQTRTSTENGSQLSLLQLAASHPPTSQTGLFITEFLVNAGLPVDPLPDGSASAFVLAVRNQYFNLADLLLEKGADINFVYRSGSSSITVLAELARSHTMKTLASIEYLLKKNASQDPKEVQSDTTIAELTSKASALSLTGRKIDFIVDKTSKLSILHVLSSCGQDVINNHSQITDRILQTVLSIFNTPEEINYTHPELGTALCVACKAGNVNAVNALLDYGANPSIPDTPANQVLQAGRTGPPLACALTSYLKEVKRPGQSLGDAAVNARLNNFEAIVEKLLSVFDDTANENRQTWNTVRAQREKVSQNLRLRAGAAAAAAAGPVDSAAVDLSVRAEQKPYQWKEGDEMNGETAMRIFLEYFMKN